MKSGLLWYDADDKKPIWDKIREAAQRYYEKFGVRPNVAFVNPAALPADSDRPAQTPALATILPNHVWLGVSDN